MRKMITTVALTWFVSALLLSTARAGDVIDRIVATVNGHIILQSDWDDALGYEALLNGRVLNQSADEDRRAVLDRLIDQELLGEQMKSASFQHASEAEAEEGLANGDLGTEVAANLRRTTKAGIMFSTGPCWAMPS